MSAEFNPIGRHSVVFAESSVDNLEEIEFQGEAVGFLGNYLGIEGCYQNDAETISIEWFPRDWIFSGKIKFCSHFKGKNLKTSQLSIKNDNKTTIKTTNKETEFVNANIAAPPTASTEISQLPNPTFCSIVRFVIRSGYLNKMLEDIMKNPSKEAVSQHTIATGEQEIVNVSLVPDLDGMVSKEERGVNWLDTVEHMLVKFPNGSRTDACSGSVIDYSFNEENYEKFKSTPMKMSITYLNAKKGSQKELTEFLVNPNKHDRRILYSAVQVDEQKFIILNKYASDSTREFSDKSLLPNDEIEHLLDLSKENIVNDRSGIVTTWYNDRYFIKQ